MAASDASDRIGQLTASPRTRALQEAIEGDSIAVLFQPQVHSGSGVVIGVEALARWAGENDTEALFVHAKAAGLVERLSRHIQRKAIASAARWTGKLDSLNVSINVVAEDICREGYDDWLLHELETHRFDPSRLTIEITESSIVADQHRASRCLTRLRRRGVRVALDDFGVGYANMTYLTRLPLDGLKIDRGLVGEIEHRRGQIVVCSLLKMAQDLGLTSVAEGVETTSQHELVRSWGCDFIQGFVAAEALDEPALSLFVAENRRHAA